MHNSRNVIFWVKLCNVYILQRIEIEIFTVSLLLVSTGVVKAKKAKGANRRSDVERRRRWEQEQEDRQTREHWELMLQIINIMRPQQLPFPNQGNRWGGPSYTSL